MRVPRRIFRWGSVCGKNYRRFDGGPALLPPESGGPAFPLVSIAQVLQRILRPLAQNSSRSLICSLLLLTGCASLFGWDIHAPGILSADFSRQIQPVHGRAALYIEPSAFNYQSLNRGSRLADPQTYHVGESFAPMLVEAFQTGFDEFIFMETEPTPGILKQYGIPYLAVVRVKDFGNRVTMKGQALTLVTETVVFNTDLKELGRYQATGSSDAKKVFAKKGGPEVNLNAAIENNAKAIVQYLQDSITTGKWNGNG